MTSYLRLEVLRALRDPKYLILAVLAPIGFYLLFATLFGGQSTGSAHITVQAALMVSMSMYGAMWAVMSATGPRIAQDRTIGWTRQMRLLPIRTANTLIARLIAAVALAGPAIVLVMLTAVFAKGVTLDDAWRWAVLLALLWLGSIPIALLGIAIGYSIGPEVAFGVLYALYLALSALGGLWMPISIMPSGMQAVGKLLPSYRAASIGWRLIGGKPFDASDALILVGWAVVFSLVALFFASRRANTR
ncbi:MAG TPA: ABC transporter permease [Ktedonobacterales bacterium]|nr:ABC transporter permease [Ktedonobacterales bacterium]